MEKIAKRLTDLIGNTPLLELNQYGSKHDLPGSLQSSNISTPPAA